jgi:hypothetical protein
MDSLGASVTPHYTQNTLQMCMHARTNAYIGVHTSTATQHNMAHTRQHSNKPTHKATQAIQATSLGLLFMCLGTPLQG